MATAAALLASVSWLGGAFAAVLTGILATLVATHVMRQSHQRAKEEKSRFARRWEESLYARMEDPNAPLPTLHPGELLLFLPLWLRIIGYVRGESETLLIAAARELDIGAQTLKLLASRITWKRSLAIRAAGALRLKEAMPALQQEIRRRDPASAEIAIVALLRIDPDAAINTLRAQLWAFVWSPSFVARLLEPAGPRAVSLLAAELANAPARRIPRLLRVIGALANTDALPILRECLVRNRSSEEVAIALEALGRFGSADDRDTARGKLGDDDALVRQHAAICLGHIGTPDDVEALRDRKSTRLNSSH